MRGFHEYPTHTLLDLRRRARAIRRRRRFGHADAIYNVIDSRQNDPQNNVVAALRGMGFTEAADHYTHFSYEMVAMTPRCAIDLGYTLSEEDRQRPFIEVSGRKGHGVKADDLIDKLMEAAQAQVDTRNPELAQAERTEIATQIAVGALRYFMLRFTPQHGDRLRLQGRAELRGRDRPVRSVCDRARDEHLPQGGHDGGGRAGRRWRA